MGAFADYAKSRAKSVFQNTAFGFGREIAYTPASTGVALTRNAVVDESERALLKFEDMTGIKAEAVMSICNDSVEGIPSVVIRDRVTIGGTIYKVVSAPPPGIDGMWNVGLVDVSTDRRGNNFLER